jgi:putative endonuclease
MHFVYVLRSQVADRRYVGSCADIEQRVDQHNAGISRSTKHWRPWILIHHEAFDTRAAAMQRERYLKTGRGREELDRMLVKV